MVTKQYATIKEMPKYFPLFTAPSLRHLIHQNTNGIQQCIKRVGRRIFFDVELFQAWLDKQNYTGE